MVPRNSNSFHPYTFKTYTVTYNCESTSWWLNVEHRTRRKCYINIQRTGFCFRENVRNAPRHIGSVAPVTLVRSAKSCEIKSNVSPSFVAQISPLYAPRYDEGSGCITEKVSSEFHKIKSSHGEASQRRVHGNELAPFSFFYSPFDVARILWVSRVVWREKKTGRKGEIEGW